MRATRVLVFVAASLSTLACDCPRYMEVVVAKRRTVGDLQYQIGSEVMTYSDLEMVDAAAFRLSPDDAGSSPPANLSFRVATGDVRRPSSSPPPFLVTIVIKGVPLGASEIDLDDQRAQVSARPLDMADVPYHDVSGHLSVRELAQACAVNCPTRANGTMTISAAGPNGEALSFTSVTFSAADEVHDGACIPTDD
jgi:hypothetical protein